MFYCYSYTLFTYLFVTSFSLHIKDFKIQGMTDEIIYIGPNVAIFLSQLRSTLHALFTCVIIGYLVICHCYRVNYHTVIMLLSLQMSCNNCVCHCARMMHLACLNNNVMHYLLRVKNGAPAL